MLAIHHSGIAHSAWVTDRESGWKMPEFHLRNQVVNNQKIARVALDISAYCRNWVCRKLNYDDDIKWKHFNKWNCDFEILLPSCCLPGLTLIRSCINLYSSPLFISLTWLHPNSADFLSHYELSLFSIRISGSCDSVSTFLFLYACPCHWMPPVVIRW